MDQIEREELEAAQRRIEERRAAAAEEAARVERGKSDVEALTPTEFDRRLRERYGVGSTTLAPRPAPLRLAASAKDDSPAAFQVRLQAVHDAAANAGEVPRAPGGDATRLTGDEFRGHLARLGVADPVASLGADRRWAAREALRQKRESEERERELVAEVRGLRADLQKVQAPPPAPAVPTERDLNRAAFYRRAKSRSFSVEG